MNLSIPGLSCHHIAMTVSNYDRSKQFYERAFGMHCYAEWTFSGKQLCFLGIGDGVCLELHSSLEEEISDGQLLHFCLHTSDIGVAYQHAIQNGAKPNRPPFDFLIEATPRPMNVKVAWLYGIDGESIELFQHIG